MSIETKPYSFSSYTKGLYPIKRVDEHAVHVIVPEAFRAKLAKRISKFEIDAITVNGVLAHVTHIEPKSPDKDLFSIGLKVQETFWKHLPLETEVSIGMLSSNPEKWLLAQSPIGTVTLKKIELAKGHQFTEELVFACSKEHYGQIANLKYNGLNGSGFFIQRLGKQGDQYTFAVHTGQDTREKTIFNRNCISEGDPCMLTLPYQA